jgi:hypothetical protein
LQYDYKSSYELAELILLCEELGLYGAVQDCKSLPAMQRYNAKLTLPSHT